MKRNLYVLVPLIHAARLAPDISQLQVLTVFPTTCPRNSTHCSGWSYSITPGKATRPWLVSQFRTGNDPLDNVSISGLQGTGSPPPDWLIEPAPMLHGSPADASAELPLCCEVTISPAPAKSL